MTYNYLKAVKEDVRIYIGEHYSEREQAEKLLDRESWEEELNDALWIEDSVTGNASGSYTFNSYKAEEYICHNLHLLSEALTEFCCDGDVLKNGAEWCDVTIRCYLLSRAILEELDNMEADDVLQALMEEIQHDDK